MSTKWVYLFDEVGDAEKYAGSWEATRALLGGKGANLGEMTRIGVPVPPGLTVTTEACNAYLENNNQFPEGMWDQELEAMKAIENSTGKKFGDKRQSAVGFLPLRCKIFHAWHDGYSAQYRSQR